MKSPITNDQFTIEGKTLRFSGIINEANTIIIGKWLMQSSGEEWTVFIDMKLERKSHD